MELLEQIGSVVIPLIIALLKINWDYRKNRERYTKDFNSLANEVHLLRSDMTSVTVDRDFRKSLRNTIVSHVAMYVKINKGTPRKVKNILTVWGKFINALASCWYNSEYRGAENYKEMTVFLMDWIKGELSMIKHFLNDEMKGVKIEHDRDQTGLLFSEWVEQNNLYAQLEILVGALAKNGYTDEEEILKEFTEFIDKFFELFLTYVLSWKLLKGKVYEDFS